MSDVRTRLGSFFLTASLVAAGLLALVLVYALAVRAFTPHTPTIRTANPTELLGDVVQVEVRNGCGTPGVAQTVTAFLRDRHFDVVDLGNYTHFDQAETVVIDRVGNPEAARSVAAALGVDEANVLQEIGPDYYLDASVVIGRDFPTLRPFADGDAP